MVKTFLLSDSDLYINSKPSCTSRTGWGPVSSAFLNLPYEVKCPQKSSPINYMMSWQQSTFFCFVLPNRTRKKLIQLVGELRGVKRWTRKVQTGTSAASDSARIGEWSSNLHLAAPNYPERHSAVTRSPGLSKLAGPYDSCFNSCWCKLFNLE